jgi:hypothetical protein
LQCAYLRGVAGAEISFFISQNVPGGDDPAGTSEEFDQVLALREEVDRLRDPVQRTHLLAAFRLTV